MGRVRGVRGGRSRGGLLFGSSVSGGGEGFVPDYYRLATFGDSRSNINYTQTGSVAVNSVMNANRVAQALATVRGDMVLCFDGGKGGSSAANWNNGGARPGQLVSDVLAASPNLVHVQFGINDIIGWNGVSPVKATMITTLATNLQAACTALLNGGVYVIFESINTCAQSAASYINGWASTGGFGANFADKLDILNQVNALMQTWFVGKNGVYVDTSSVFSDVGGYAKTDGTHGDGTHGSSFGALPAAQLVDTAISSRFPARTTVLPGSGANAIIPFHTNPTAGKAQNLTTAADQGTWDAETFSISGVKQVINFNCTALTGGGIARRFVNITPLIVGAGATVPVTAGDVLQGRIFYSIDDGAGGGPNAYAIALRERIFYDDASNELTTFGQPNAITSTDWPAMIAHSGHLMTLRLPVKAGLASANMLNTTVLQVNLYANTTGATRLMLWGAELKKVA